MGEGTGWEVWYPSKCTPGKLEVNPCQAGPGPVLQNQSADCTVPFVCGSSFSPAGLWIP